MIEGDDEVNGPPSKKRKTNDAAKARPRIVKLVGARNVVVAATDDKVIHVYELDSTGTLHRRSQRCMLKRPCAVVILYDSQLILCGDKFGDVYSIPLHPDAERDAEVSQRQLEPKQHRVAADEKTVHTKRNQTILKAQRKQITAPERKAPLMFEHKVLLGHVSMLTDMIFVKSGISDGRGRIITADRDEHIRVSRSPVQAHIIEGYCLGHEEFISKLCAIPGTELFASGGGDEIIKIWNWSTCQLVYSINVRDTVQANMSEPQPGRLVLSGMWHVDLGDDGKHALLLAFERIPLLLTLTLSVNPLNTEPVLGTKILDANPLDVVIQDSKMICALDVRSGAARLGVYSVKPETDGSLTLVSDEKQQDLVKQLNEVESDNKDMDDGTLDGLLYNIGNLRKRSTPAEAQEDLD